MLLAQSLHMSVCILDRCPDGNKRQACFRIGEITNSTGRSTRGEDFNGSPHTHESKSRHKLDQYQSALPLHSCGLGFSDTAFSHKIKQKLDYFRKKDLLHGTSLLFGMVVTVCRAQWRAVFSGRFLTHGWFDEASTNPGDVDLVWHRE